MTVLPRHPNVELAVRYHEAVSQGASPQELSRFLHPDIEHRELPNLLFPQGATRDLAGMHAAAEQGRRTIREQRFEVLGAVASGDTVALEVLWTGVLAVPLGDLPAGHVLRAHIATFLEFRDGLIRAQRNYDCYEPLRP
ncbi:nuclear transport factor 2 family protein [Thermomonospora amylolytica]|uniref:nuclear transport factor 2 family protein n=1 Tax=Thermomonospora amylolytica TaxID=1411117 RepID=UPI000E6D061B|nr:nuclear transport factor 2 family protein [Thermomonospora amylolytica]